MKPRLASLRSLLGLITFAAVVALLVVLLRDLSGNEECFPLIRTLQQSRDPVERREAVEELGRLRLRGDRTTAAIRPLIERLDDANQDVRDSAAQSLLYFGPEARPAVPVLARLMRTQATGHRASAMRLLGAIGTAEASDVLADALNDPDPERLLETIEVLKTIRFPSTSFFPVLRERLRNDPDASVREAVLPLLVQIDRDTERVLQAILLACRDVSAEVRAVGYSLLPAPRSIVSNFRYADLVYDLGASSTDLVHYLSAFREAMHYKDDHVRAAALHGMRNIGLRHAGAITSLCEALKEPLNRDAAAKEIRLFPAWGSWQVDRDNPANLDLVLDAAVPALSGAMESDDTAICGVVASLLCRLIALSEIEHPPPPLSLHAGAESLRARLSQHDPVFRRHLLTTLLLQSPTELLSPVLGDLLEEHSDLALETAGPGNHTERRAAIDSLIAKAKANAIEITKSGRSVMTRYRSLIDLLPERVIRSIIPEVCAALADENENLRHQAMAVITNQRGNRGCGLNSDDTGTRRIILALQRALKDRVPEIREQAASNLAALDPSAKDSERAIREAIANEQNPTVRSNMEEALQQRVSNDSAPKVPR